MFSVGSAPRLYYEDPGPAGRIIDSGRLRTGSSVEFCKELAVVIEGTDKSSARAAVTRGSECVKPLVWNGC